jgi:hypothetical protein
VTDPKPPRVVPGIPTAARLLRSKQITLPDVPRPTLPGLDPVTEIQRHPSRQDDRSEATDTPIEPWGARHGSRSQGQREPRSMSPAFGTPESAIPQLRAAVEQQGDRLELPPVSAPSVPPPPRPRPAFELEWWRTTSGMLKIMAAVPVMLAASTASVVAIINALRQPADPDLVKDIALARKEVAGLRRYVEQKDIAREEQTQRRLDGMNSRILDLDARYPAPKKNPRRAPKETDAAP